MPDKERATLLQSLHQNALKPARNCVGTDRTNWEWRVVVLVRFGDGRMDVSYDLYAPEKCDERDFFF